MKTTVAIATGGHGQTQTPHPQTPNRHSALPRWHTIMFVWWRAVALPCLALRWAAGGGWVRISKGVGRGWGQPMLAAGARKPSLERRTTLVGQRPPACKSGPTSVSLPRSPHACGEWPSPFGRSLSVFLSSRFRICSAVVSHGGGVVPFPVPLRSSSSSPTPRRRARRM